MPIYEFVCAHCGERFERLASAGTERERCPECGEEGAERVLSAFAPAPKLVKSPGDARRLEDKRGTNRGGAMDRFKKQRSREKGRGGG
jgi:putative FmdB family regulatory protein